MKKTRFFFITFIISIATATSVYAKTATLGQSVILNYSSSNASTCSQINTPLGYPTFFPAANTAGSYTLTAGNSGTFTLTCSNAGGSTSASDVLTVTTPAPTVTISQFSPSTISTGQASSLSFSSTNATSCSGSGIIDENLGTSATNLSTGAMNTAGVYSQSITCTGPGGTGTAGPVYLTVSNPTGALNLTPSSCVISANGSTCTSVASWTTTGATAPILKDMNVGSTLSTSPNSTGLTVWVAYPYTTFNLQEQNGSRIYSTKTVTSSCIAGSAWDAPTNKCKALPPTVNATLSGQNTPLGTISLTCTNSNSWSVVRTEGGFTKTGTGSTALVSITDSGNYTVNCIGWDATATAALFYASYALLPADMSIIAMPVTIQAGSASSISWSVTNATTSCMITAAPVCSGTCSQSRLDAVAVINSTLQTGKTDANDIYNLTGSLRTIKNAIQTVAPANNPTGLKALGKKTMPINFTTDFTLDCGPGNAYQTLTPKKVRVQVTNETQG
ncbi:MAG: hypothetical protein WCT07_01510 [Candidatus Paceibacterota bacterium]|jgi:hypothetical protein